MPDGEKNGKKLVGHVALVTKAGSGIGRATTLKPLKEGANVLAIDRNEEGLNQTLELRGVKLKY